MIFLLFFIKNDFISILFTIKILISLLNTSFLFSPMIRTSTFEDVQNTRRVKTSEPLEVSEERANLECSGEVWMRSVFCTSSNLDVLIIGEKRKEVLYFSFKNKLEIWNMFFKRNKINKNFIKLKVKKIIILLGGFHQSDIFKR